MRPRIGNELILLDVLVMVLVAAIILFPSNILRIILGIPFLLFFPGYALLAALFPKSKALGDIERVALSFALSLAIVPLIGLIINYTPWRIRLEPVLYSVASFIFISSVIAWVRQSRLAPGDRFSVKFRLAVPGWGRGILDKSLFLVLMISMFGAIGVLGYFIVTPKVGERFTEFYVTGLEGTSIDYLGELKVGEEGRVIVGIVNHEKEDISYRVEVRIDGVTNNEVVPPRLGDEQKWEEIVSLAPDRAGDNRKVEFLLYKNSESEPYLKPLHLWINVRE